MSGTPNSYRPKDILLASHIQLMQIKERCIFCIKRAKVFVLSFLLQFLSTSTVPLTTVVTFTDMTEWPEPPRGQPQIHWKLPFDIFYPFKVAYNLERSYRGDLVVYFLLILITSSILFF